MTTNRKSAEEWRVSIEKRHLNSGQYLTEQIQQIITSERNAAYEKAAETIKHMDRYGSVESKVQAILKLKESE